MSFLSEKIRKVRSMLKNTGSDLKASVNGFRKEIWAELDKLQRKDNLQVFHTCRGNYLGGVLRGPRRYRQQFETKDSRNAVCQTQYFDKDSLEVPYFRSAFNVKNRLLADTTVDNAAIRIIAYESPLMRRQRGRGSRAISCDLVGISSDNCVTCIEGKVNPGSQNTDIVYGLLEGCAYAVCVDYYLSDSNLRCLFGQELQACCKDFHPNFSETIAGKDLTAAFALAAPASYFMDYFTPEIMTDGVATRRVEEMVRLLDTFTEIEELPTWKGFLICNQRCDKRVFEKQRSDITRDGKKCCEPHFRDDELKVTPAYTMQELRNLTDS